MSREELIESAAWAFGAAAVTVWIYALVVLLLIYVPTILLGLI